MLTLAIETSNPGPSGIAGAHACSGSVCVGETSPPGTPVRVLSTRELAPASRHDDALMPAVDAACRECGVTPTSLRRVAVSIGPGGFTSTRIAVTTAKMIAEATGAECVAVPTARAAALALRADHPNHTVGVLLAWKRADAWRCRYRVTPGDAEPLDDERSNLIVPLDRAAESLDLLCCDPALRDALPEDVRLRCVPITFHARLVLEACARFPPVDPAHLLPLYPREPEAVTKWRALHPPR